MENVLAPAAPNVDKMKDSLTTFAKTGKVTGEMSRVLGSDFQSLAQNINVLDEKNRTLANSAVMPGGLLVASGEKG